MSLNVWSTYHLWKKKQLHWIRQDTIHNISIYSSFCTINCLQIQYSYQTNLDCNQFEKRHTLPINNIKWSPHLHPKEHHTYIYVPSINSNTTATQTQTFPMHAIYPPSIIHIHIQQSGSINSFGNNFLLNFVYFLTEFWISQNLFSLR